MNELTRIEGEWTRSANLLFSDRTQFNLFSERASRVEELPYSNPSISSGDIIYCLSEVEDIPMVSLRQAQGVNGALLFDKLRC